MIVTGSLLVLCFFILLASNKFGHYGVILRIPILMFISGNIGSYVGTHKNLSSLQNKEVVDLSSSWLSLIVPSFIGGTLALVLLLLFMSGIVAGDLFPKFVATPDARVGIESLFDQHGEGMKDYAKLMLWGFIAGFNQKYIVDIINSIKDRAH